MLSAALVSAGGFASAQHDATPTDFAESAKGTLTMQTTEIRKPRLLMLAHTCCPESGSEPGMGWNRAIEAAKWLPTWVLCDEHFCRESIEKYLATHGPIENLNFVYVPTNRWELRLRSARGAYYAAYNLWHRRAFKIARRLHEQLHFDLVHQVSLCGFREPGYLWKLDAPFIWGPVGGAQNYPWRFLLRAGLKGTCTEAVRGVLNCVQARFSRRVGRAARRAAVLLAANESNAEAMRCRRHGDVEVFVEIGLSPPRQLPARDFRHRGPLRLLWNGVFEHRKALHLLLEALAQLPPEVSYELRILGRGPMNDRWRRLARKYEVEPHCCWLGWLEHGKVLNQFLWADAFVFTSLRDTTGTVVLESLSAGTPVICLDHQGAGEIIDSDCGVKLPVTTPADVVARLAAALTRLSREPQELARLSRGALAKATELSWERHGAAMAAVYRRVLADRLPQADCGEGGQLASTFGKEHESQLNQEPTAALA